MVWKDTRDLNSNMQGGQVHLETRLKISWGLKERLSPLCGGGADGLPLGIRHSLCCFGRFWYEGKYPLWGALALHALPNTSSARDPQAPCNQLRFKEETHPKEELEQRLFTVALRHPCHLPWRNFCRPGAGSSPLRGNGGRIATAGWKLSAEPQGSGPQWFFDIHL